MKRVKNGKKNIYIFVAFGHKSRQAVLANVHVFEENRFGNKTDHNFPLDLFIISLLLCVHRIVSSQATTVP